MDLMVFEIVLRSASGARSSRTDGPAPLKDAPYTVESIDIASIIGSKGQAPLR